MRYCCVPMCNSRYEGATTVSFFEFPSNAERRKAWIIAIRRRGEKPGSVWKPTDHSSVCDKHFIDDDFSKSTRRKRLLPSAIPSIFPGYPSVVNQAEKVTNSTLIENQRDSVEEKSCDSVSDSSTLTASISNGEEEKSDEPEIETICDISSTKSISPSKRKSRNLNGIRNCSDVEKNSDIEDTEKGIRNCSDVEKNSDIEDTEKDIRNCSDVEKNSDIEDIEKGIRNCSDVEKNSDIEDIEKTRKKRKVNCLSPPENMMDVPEVLSAQNNFHREDIFGHYVVSELRALKDNPLLYLQTKQSILEILTSAHLEYLNPPE